MKLTFPLFILAALVMAGCKPVKPLAIGGGGATHVPPAIDSKVTPVVLVLELSVWGDAPSGGVESRWKDIACRCRYDDSADFARMAMVMTAQESNKLTYEAELDPLEDRAFVEYFFETTLDGHKDTTPKYKASYVYVPRPMAFQAIALDTGREAFSKAATRHRESVESGVASQGEKAREYLLAWKTARVDAVGYAFGEKRGVLAWIEVRNEALLCVSRHMDQASFRAMVESISKDIQLDRATGVVAEDGIVFFSTVVELFPDILGPDAK